MSIPENLLAEGTHEAPAAKLVPLLEHTLSSAAVGLFYLDHQGRIVEISSGLAQLLGYNDQELRNTDGFLMLHPDERSSARLNLLTLIGKKKSNRAIERRYLRKDGSPIWVLVSIGHIPGPLVSGEPSYVAQVTPINKQKEAEQKAADALENWNFALDSAGQGLWDFDLEKSTWYFSPAWRRMRGIPEDEFVSGDTDEWLSFIHPDDRDRVAHIATDQNNGKLKEVSYEYRERRRDGSWMWIMARGRCIDYFPDGTARRIIGTDTDITDLKQRELEFAHVSERLNLALTTSKVGVWVADRLSYESTWDARACEIFGHAPIEGPLPDRHWERTLHPADKIRTLLHTSQCFRDRTDYACDYRILTPAGETRHVRTLGRLSKDADGRDQMIGIVFDVTEEVKWAEALESARRLAEQRAAELETARAAMEHASLHDALTDLPNRRYLDQLLQNISEGGMRKDDLTILHLDLDRFKQINDTRGHAAGDCVLVHMASMLKAIVGPENTVARIGGDEFVIALAPSPEPKRLKSMLTEIISRTNVPIFWEGQECRTSTSIGIAESDGKTDALQLLINADLALYRAKNLGRNRFAFFNGQMRAEIVAQKQCGDDILRAITRKEFFPYYQPQFCAASLNIIGVEALARWHHPERGILTPDKFLAVAEDINAIPDIDHLILQTALDDLAKWDQSGIPIPKVSVNVSAKRLADKKLIENIRSAQWARGRIGIELLESIFLDDNDADYAKNIEALTELGADIEIDDFGTGHASIVSLLRLNPYRLKIDRQLIAPIVESEQQRRLVKSIVEIGKSQNIEVCAEGVETAQHVEILREIGCDCLQGYFFGRPMPAEELTEYVRSENWRKF